MVLLHIHECCRCTPSSSCFISSHLLLSLAQSTAAAATCILPAASYHDGDSTVGANAGWCWLNGTLHHLKQTNSHTHTYRATAPKMLSASRPSNNSSPAIARVRPHRCSQIWVNDTLKLAEISRVTLVAFGDSMHILKCWVLLWVKLLFRKLHNYITFIFLPSHGSQVQGNDMQTVK